MPITTRKALHGSVGPAIKYITQDKKTENQKYVSSNNCGIATAEEEMNMIQRKFHQEAEPQFLQKNLENTQDSFEEIKENFESIENIEEDSQENNKDIIDGITSSNRKNNKGEPRTGYHIIQSFPLEDDVSYDEAHEMGIELAKELYPNYQSVIATHTDRTHVHNHIVMNSIDMNTGKKLEDKLSDKEGSLYSLRRKSNEIAQKHGYSISEEPRITTYKKRNYAYKPLVWKDILLGLVDYLLTIAKTLKEFLSELLHRGFDIKDESEISIKHKSSKNYTRLDKISGGVYSKSNLEKFFELGAPSLNGEPLIKYFPKISKILKKDNNYFKEKKEKDFNKLKEEKELKDLKDLKNAVRLKEKNIVKDYNDLLNKVEENGKENYEDVVNTDSNFLSNLNNLTNFDNSNESLDISDEEFALRLNEILNSQNSQDAQDNENNFRKSGEENFDSLNLFDGNSQNYLYIPLKNDCINSPKDDSMNIHIPFINKNISVRPNHIHQIPFSFYKDFSFLKVEIDEDVIDDIDSIDKVFKENANKSLQDSQPIYKNLVGDNQILNVIDKKIISLKKELNELNNIKSSKNIQEDDSLPEHNASDKNLDIDNKKTILLSKINYYQQKQKELYSYLLKEDISSYEELAEKNYSISKENSETESKMELENKEVINYLEERIHLNNYLNLKQTERNITNVLEIQRNGNEKILDNFIISYKDSIDKYLNSVKILMEDVTQNHQFDEKETENLKNILSAFEKSEDSLFEPKEIKNILIALLDDKNNEKTSHFFKNEIKNIAKTVSQELKSYNKTVAKNNRNIKNNSLLNQIILSKNDYILFKSFENFKNSENNFMDIDKNILTKVKTDIDVLLKINYNSNELNYSNLFFENTRNDNQNNIQSNIQNNSQKDIRNLLPILDDTNNNYYLIPLQECVFENSKDEFNEKEFNKKVTEFNEKKKQNDSSEDTKSFNGFAKNNEDDYEILEEEFDGDLLNALSNLNNNLNNSNDLNSEESYLDENFLENLTSLTNLADENKIENIEQSDNIYDKADKENINNASLENKKIVSSLDIKVLLNPNENYCKVSKDIINSLIENRLSEKTNEQSEKNIIINLESIDPNGLKFESFDETIKHINIEDNNTDNRQIDTEIELAE